MTNFLIPYTFVPGTKAKAEEVNANFEALKQEVCAKALNTGESTRTFAVAPAITDFDAVNKAQLDESLDYIKKSQVRYAVNSGHRNIKNEAELIYYYNNQVAFYVGDGEEGNYKPLSFTTLDGNTCIKTSLANIDMSGYEDGVYNIFVGEGETSYVLKNKFYYQKKKPQDMHRRFVQPVLSANGTMGVDDFAVAATVTHPAFSGYTFDPFNLTNAVNNEWSSNVLPTSAQPQIITWFIKDAIKLESIDFRAGSSQTFGRYEIQGSNDNISWTTLKVGENTYNSFLGNFSIKDINSEEYYKYIRLVIYSVVSGSSALTNLCYAKLNGFLDIEVPLEQNDVWIDTSITPMAVYKYNGLDWKPFEDLAIGKVIIENSQIVAVETYDYNHNHYIDDYNWRKSFINSDVMTSLTPFTKCKAPCDGWIVSLTSTPLSVTIESPFLFKTFVMGAIPIAKGTVYSVDSVSVFFECKGEM